MVIPGQPPSMNHAYHPTVLRLKSGKTAHTISKTKVAQSYQDLVLQLAKTARPSGWTVPKGTFVRMKFWYHLNPDIDCDNIKKLVIDALVKAIPTDDPTKMLNDRWVYSCDVAKGREEKGKQRVVVEISLETTPHE